MSHKISNFDYDLDYNQLSDKEKQAILEQAINDDRVDVAKILAENGVDVDLITSVNDSVFVGDEYCDIYIPAVKSNNPILKAIEKGNPEMIGVLVEYSKKVNEDILTLDCDRWKSSTNYLISALDECRFSRKEPISPSKLKVVDIILKKVIEKNSELTNGSSSDEYSSYMRHINFATAKIFKDNDIKIENWAKVDALKEIMGMEVPTIYNQKSGKLFDILVDNNDLGYFVLLKKDSYEDAKKFISDAEFLDKAQGFYNGILEINKSNSSYKSEYLNKEANNMIKFIDYAKNVFESTEKGSFIERENKYFDGLLSMSLASKDKERAKETINLALEQAPYLKDGMSKVFDTAEKMSKENPQLAYEVMVNVYNNANNKDEYLSRLYDLRKGGTRKENVQVAKEINNVLDANPELDKTKEIRSLGKVDNIITQPTKFVKKRISR